MSRWPEDDKAISKSEPSGSEVYIDRSQGSPKTVPKYGFISNRGEHQRSHL